MPSKINSKSVASPALKPVPKPVKINVSKKTINADLIKKA